MCDIGRFDYHWIEGDDRLRRPLVRDAHGVAAAGVVARRDRRSSPTGWPPPVDRIPTASGSCCPRMRRTKSCSCSAASTEELLGSDGRQRSRSAGGISRRRNPRTRRSRCRRRCAQRERRANVRAGARTGRRRSTASRSLGASKAAVEAGKVAALYVFDPGPDGSIGRHDLDRRRATRRPAAAADRAGRAADRSGPRGRFRAAGRIVRREGSVLYQRTGTPAGHGARDSPPGRGDGRLADSRQPRRRARRAVRLRRARRRCAPTSPLGSAAQRARGDDALAFGQPVSARHWLQASNPSERWKWDFMFQDLPPVKGSVDPDGAAAAARGDPAQRSEVNDHSSADVSGAIGGH